MRLTLVPAKPVPVTLTLLALLIRAMSLSRAMNEAVQTTSYSASSQIALLQDCCALLSLSRYSASRLPEEDVATFYIELLSIFRGANRFSFEEAGLRLTAEGRWEVDARQVKRHVWAYPQVSRLFVKTFLRVSFEPLVNRWACRLEMHR